MQFSWQFQQKTPRQVVPAFFPAKECRVYSAFGLWLSPLSPLLWPEVPFLSVWIKVRADILERNWTVLSTMSLAHSMSTARCFVHEIKCTRLGAAITNGPHVSTLPPSNSVCCSAYMVTVGQVRLAPSLARFPCSCLALVGRRINKGWKKMNPSQEGRVASSRPSSSVTGHLPKSTTCLRLIRL